MTIVGKNLNIAYGNKLIIKDTSITVNKGEIVTIIGPNGSGKSTLIKALSRCIKPKSGDVFLNGNNIYDLPNKEIAKEMAVLPQVKNVTDDIRVEDLVSYGRYPHLGFGKRLNTEDRKIIDWAISKTGLEKLKDRQVITLSGGERQRAWIAMALAQEPKILMLDEPTTYLDISYQMEVLELIKELNESLGITVIMVLHDLNQAARYSDQIYVLEDGRMFKEGKPKQIINTGLLEDIFRIKAHIYQDQVNDCPYFIAHKIV